MLEFLIRTPPARGKLSAVKNTGMNSATVIYTPTSVSNLTEDRFTYAVRGSEGVSAPGVIVLRFIEPTVMAARLRAPAEIEFPPVFPGQQSTAEMKIANEGGTVLEGEVSVVAPWTIDGLKIFKIAAGQTATFKVSVIPARSGILTGEAVIQTSGKKSVDLRVSAEERLEATPKELKLTAQAGSQTRKGVLRITNRSHEDALATVDTGPRLITNRTVNVPAKGTASVPLFADAAEAGAFDETVKLRSEEWSEEVAIRVPAVGAILKFSKETLDLRANAGDAEARETAVLENSGAEAATVQLDFSPPFEVEPRVVTVPAGGRVDVPVFIRNPKQGNHHSVLKIASEEKSAVMQITASIGAAGEARTRAPRSAPLESVEARTPSEEIKRVEESASSIPQDLRETPNALGRFAKITGADTAKLEWPAEIGGPENARVEERVLSLSPTDELFVDWVPFPNATITTAGESVTAELRGLKPDTIYTVRVIAGNAVDPAIIFTSDFWTPQKPSFFKGSPRSYFLAGALAILVVAIWRERKRRQETILAINR